MESGKFKCSIDKCNIKTIPGKSALAIHWQHMHLELWNSFSRDSLYNVVPEQNRYDDYEVKIENGKFITMCKHCDVIIIDETHKGMIDHWNLKKHTCNDTKRCDYFMYVIRNEFRYFCIDCEYYYSCFDILKHFSKKHEIKLDRQVTDIYSCDTYYNI